MKTFDISGWTKKLNYNLSKQHFYRLPQQNSIAIQKINRADTVGYQINLIDYEENRFRNCTLWNVFLFSAECRVISKI